MYASPLKPAFFICHVYPHCVTGCREVRPGGLVTINISEFLGCSQKGRRASHWGGESPGCLRQKWFGINNEATLAVVVLDEDELALVALGHDAVRQQVLTACTALHLLSMRLLLYVHTVLYSPLTRRAMHLPRETLISTPLPFTTSYILHLHYPRRLSTGAGAR
jgi:hypothetical protein